MMHSVRGFPLAQHVGALALALAPKHRYALTLQRAVHRGTMLMLLMMLLLLLPMLLLPMLLLLRLLMLNSISLPPSPHPPDGPCIHLGKGSTRAARDRLGTI